MVAPSVEDDATLAESFASLHPCFSSRIQVRHVIFTFFREVNKWMDG